MLISTLIILYIITGTSVDDINNVRVYFLSVKINRPEILVWFACVLFLWYWYQYWLTHRAHQGFRADRQNELRNQPFLKKFAEKKIKRTEKRSLKIKVGQLRLVKSDNKFLLNATQVSEEVANESWEAGSNRTIEVSAIRWRWLHFRNWCSVAFTRKTSFWDQVFPHIFALITLVLGVANWLGKIPA